MKLLALFIAFILFAISLVHCNPIAESFKCRLACDLQEFKPICGTDDGGETKTFNNLCTMKTENCLRSLTFQKISDGDCP